MTYQQTQAAARPLTFNYWSLLNGLLWLAVAFSSFTLVEPAPYDILLLLLWVVWFFSGFRLHKSVIPFVALLFLHNLAGFFALVPYFSNVDATTYYYYSLYMLIAATVFAMLFAQDLEQRADIMLRGYVVAALLASVLAIIGYFDLWNTARIFAPEGRSSGPFKDPNVFASYLIPPELYLLQGLLTGETKTLRGAILSAVGVGVMLMGLLLSFSRGSWGATIIATLMMAGMAFATAKDLKERGRIIMIFWIVVALVVVGLTYALSIESVREIFVLRATVAQDYDSGETGRFGNQKRSIPLLLDHPQGLGPLIFRKYFGIEPHNSYVSAFANFGWFGGFAFILWVGVSCYVGFRLCAKKSPFRRQAQVLFPPVFVWFLQALQIDIDHWRFIYLVLGAVWGLEAARQKWEARQCAAPRAASASR